VVLFLFFLDLEEYITYLKAILRPDLNLEKKYPPYIFALMMHFFTCFPIK